MSYCTQQNLIDRFGELELIQLTDRVGAGVINTTVLNQAISDADAEINAYLIAYPLPLTVVPAHLVRLASDIARYHLYGNQMLDAVSERYKSALRYLEQVAKGVISIGPDSTGMTPTAIDGIGIEFSSSASVFARS